MQNGFFSKKEVSTLLELRSCNQATFNEMIPGFLDLLWGISHNHPSLEKENYFVFIFYFHLHKETFAINFHINITDALHAFLFVQRHYIWYEEHQIIFFFLAPPLSIVQVSFAIWEDGSVVLWELLFTVVSPRGRRKEVFRMFGPFLYDRTTFTFHSWD